MESPHVKPEAPSPRTAAGRSHLFSHPSADMSVKVHRLALDKNTGYPEPPPPHYHQHYYQPQQQPHYYEQSPYHHQPPHQPQPQQHYYPHGSHSRHHSYDYQTHDPRHSGYYHHGHQSSHSAPHQFPPATPQQPGRPEDSQGVSATRTNSDSTMSDQSGQLETAKQSTGYGALVALSFAMSTPSTMAHPPPGISQNVCTCPTVPKIPRPRNAFILYRQSRQQEVSAAHPGLPNPEISKIIGDNWKKENENIKEHFKQLAEEEKLEHARKHPDYRYQPKRSVKAGQRPDEQRSRCPKCGGVINPALSTANSRLASSSLPLAPAGQDPGPSRYNHMRNTASLDSRRDFKMDADSDVSMAESPDSGPNKRRRHNNGSYSFYMEAPSAPLGYPDDAYYRQGPPLPPPHFVASTTRHHERRESMPGPPSHFHPSLPHAHGYTYLPSDPPHPGYRNSQWPPSAYPPSAYPPHHSPSHNPHNYPGYPSSSYSQPVANQARRGPLPPEVPLERRGDYSRRPSMHGNSDLPPPTAYNGYPNHATSPRVAALPPPADFSKSRRDSFSQAAGHLTHLSLPPPTGHASQPPPRREEVVLPPLRTQVPPRDQMSHPELSREPFAAALPRQSSQPAAPPAADRQSSARDEPPREEPPKEETAAQTPRQEVATPAAQTPATQGSATQGSATQDSAVQPSTAQSPAAQPQPAADSDQQGWAGGATELRDMDAGHSGQAADGGDAGHLGTWQADVARDRAAFIMSLASNFRAYDRMQANAPMMATFHSGLGPSYRPRPTVIAVDGVAQNETLLAISNAIARILQNPEYGLAVSGVTLEMPPVAELPQPPLRDVVPQPQVQDRTGVYSWGELFRFLGARTAFWTSIDQYIPEISDRRHPVVVLRNGYRVALLSWMAQALRINAGSSFDVHRQMMEHHLGALCTPDITVMVKVVDDNDLLIFHDFDRRMLTVRVNRAQGLYTGAMQEIAEKVRDWILPYVHNIYYR